MDVDEESSMTVEPDSKRRRVMIKEKFEALVTEAKDYNLCLSRGKDGHTMDVCEDKGAPMMRKSLANVAAKLTLQEGDVGSAPSTKDAGASSSSIPKPSCSPEMKMPPAKGKINSRFSREWIQQRLSDQTADVLYMTPLSLEV